MSESAPAGRARNRRPSIGRNQRDHIALGSGTGIGAVAVWLIGLSGTDVPPEVSAVIAGVVAWAVMVVGRCGIKPALARLWNGSGAEEDQTALEGSANPAY
jgi:hypothetical protein